MNKLQNGIFVVITQQWHGNRAIIGLAIFMIAAIRSPVARASLLYSSQSHQNSPCSTRNNECLSFFAESGQESEHQTTPHLVQGKLISAAVQGNLEEVKRLLTQGAEINGTGRAGHTALIVASAQGHTAVVQYLLERGANINARGKNDATALIAAARRWHEEIVQLLLDHGADVHARTRFHVTALLAALSGEGFLYDAELGVYEPKQFVITHENLSSVQHLLTLLLNHGADVDVNVKNREGKTALRLAVETGHAELVQTLLQHGAQVQGKAKDGQTALMVAEAKGLTKIMRMLQQAGAMQ